MSFMWVLILLLVFLSSSILLIAHVRKHSPFMNWPLVGAAPELLMNIGRFHDFINEAAIKSDGTFELKGPLFTNFSFVATSDPMNMHHVLTKNFTNYPKGQEFKDIFELLGDGVFNADSESWKFQRKLIHFTFKHEGFSKAVGAKLREKVANGLIPVLDHIARSGVEVDFQDVLMRLTFDHTCSVVLGFDPLSLRPNLPHVTAFKAFDDLEVAILHRHTKPKTLWRLMSWLQLGLEKNLTEGGRTIDELIYGRIRKKLSQPEEQKSQYGQKEACAHDFLTMLVNEFYYKNEGHDQEENYHLSCNNIDKLLRDILVNLLFAGKDTVGAALAWFFWLVATNPSVETKILQEISQNFEDEHEIDITEVQGMVYLHAALCETLRLYPPVPINHKSAVSKDVLPNGRVVKPNTGILLLFYSLGRREDVWGKDCLEFKPERWITNTDQKGMRIEHVPSYKFVAFNAGPRTCLGKDFSFTQMKSIAIAVLRNYRVRVVEGQCVVPSASIVMPMKHGFKVTISKRSSCIQWRSLKEKIWRGHAYRSQGPTIYIANE